MESTVFAGKTLLITGGTGSFGNTVLKHFLSTDIGEIRIFSRDEKKQDDMRHDYQLKYPELSGKIKFYIGDVRNPDSLRGVMRGVDYIFHAAALKQVPSCEFFPMEAVRTNVLGTDSDYTSFLTYYRLMLDMITQALPGTPVYVQSITPVRPEVAAKKGHEGLNRDRLCRINDELAAVALEKNCYFLNLWEVLADENGDLKAEYAQPDGYHLKPEGYTAWVDYLCSHTAG